MRDMISLISKLSFETLMTISLHGQLKKKKTVANGVESSATTKQVMSQSLTWPHLVLKWQGNIREFSSNIGLLRSIDLSSNNLTGKIPNELTDLRGLLALNLSNNALLGEIPQKIGEMKEVQILDLSSNNLSGGLPSTMSQINFLNYLDVSYNNLSGSIPSSTQLQSFGPSRYIGNAGLCGPPVTKNCPGDEELEVPSTDGESEGGGEGIDELEGWFYIGGAMVLLLDLG